MYMWAYLIWCMYVCMRMQNIHCVSLCPQEQLINCLACYTETYQLHTYTYIHTYVSCMPENLQSFTLIYFSCSTRLLCDFILSIVAIVLTFVDRLVYTDTHMPIWRYASVCTFAPVVAVLVCPPIATMWSKNSPYWTLNKCSSTYNYNNCDNKHHNNN